MAQANKEKKRKGNDYDEACACVMKADALGLLVWLLRALKGDIEFVAWLPTKSIQWPGQPGRTCDTVAHVVDLTNKNMPWMVVAEFQIEADALMFGRLNIYEGHAWIDLKPVDHKGDRFFVGAVVVNLTGRGDCSVSAQLGHSRVKRDDQVSEWNFQDEIAADLVKGVEAGHVPLVALVWLPLFRGGGSLKLAQRARELFDLEKDPRKRQVFELALLFADKAGCLDDWNLALEGWNVTQSKVANLWRDEARAEGQAKGEAKGRRAWLLKALEKKAKGALPDPMRKAIEAIEDVARLDELFDLALTSGSFSAFSKKANL